jgi:hypothetical protein
MNTPGMDSPSASMLWNTMVKSQYYPLYIPPEDATPAEKAVIYNPAFKLIFSNDVTTLVPRCKAQGNKKFQVRPSEDDVFDPVYGFLLCEYMRARPTKSRTQIRNLLDSPKALGPIEAIVDVLDPMYPRTSKAKWTKAILVGDYTIRNQLNIMEWDAIRLVIEDEYEAQKFKTFQ